MEFEKQGIEHSLFLSFNLAEHASEVVGIAAPIMWNGRIFQKPETIEHQFFENHQATVDSVDPT